MKRLMPQPSGFVPGVSRHIPPRRPSTAFGSVTRYEMCPFIKASPREHHHRPVMSPVQWPAGPLSQFHSLRNLGRLSGGAEFTTWRRPHRWRTDDVRRTDDVTEAGIMWRRQEDDAVPAAPWRAVASLPLRHGSNTDRYALSMVRRSQDRHRIQ